MSLRSHLASVLDLAGGGAALVGQTVWSFWYADWSVFEVNAKDSGGKGGAAAARHVVQTRRSPIRGNWFEAVVLSFDANDSVLWVSGPGEAMSPVLTEAGEGIVVLAGLQFFR